MNLKLLLAFFFLGIGLVFSQTKVSGHVYDEDGVPASYCNVVFKGSTEGTITDENGSFYLESDETWNTVTVSFLGYQTLNITLTKKVNYNLEFVIKEEVEQLNTVVIVSGKQSKDEKENPAVALLKKIWAHKRKNGLKQFKQYEYDKYE